MADTETPQERQERIRRQKREAREAKITGDATGRLDKITALSGRTPELTRNSPPAPTPPISDDPPVVLPSPPQRQAPANQAPLNGPAAGPGQFQGQEDFLRAMLRAQNTPQQGAPESAQGNGSDQEDPMMKMLSSLLGGMNNDPNAPAPNIPSPNDLAKAAGVPPFVMNMLMGGQQKAPPTPAQAQTARMWKTIHIVFAIVLGIYTVFTIGRSMSIFGDNPPAPATVQNPLIAFLMGELLIQGSRTVSSSQIGAMGLGYWYSILKELGQDAAIVVFLLGMFTWLKGAA